MSSPLQMPAARRVGLGLVVVGCFLLPVAALGQNHSADEETSAETLPLPPDRAGWRFDREQSNTLAAPLTPSLALQPGGGSQAQTQTMLWARRERLGLGFGVEQRWTPIAPLPNFAPPPSAVRDAGMRVGLAWATGDSSQVTWTTPLLPQQRAGEAGNWPGVDRPADRDRDVRLGLEFRKSDALSDLRRGALMRLELSRDTTLSLKPRGGRVGLTLASHW